MQESGEGLAVGLWPVGAVLAAAGCVAVSAGAWWRRRRARARARAVLAAVGADKGAGLRRSPARLRERAVRMKSTVRRGKAVLPWTTWRQMQEGAAALGVGALVPVVVGGSTGWVLGGAVSCGVWHWLRTRTARDVPTDASATSDATSETRAAAGQLPLVADLMAACLAAGSGPWQAADAVGRSLGGPIGARLVRAATELRLGADPAVAWGRFASLRGSEGFARCMERAETTGVPAAESVTRLAGELRAGQARLATARARRAAVLVAAPMGLCFLPAFLVVGVVPVVIGLARSLL